MKMNRHQIAYFEDNDFDFQGNLIHPFFRSKPVLVMLQSSNCHHCQIAKPSFEEFAANTDKVDCGMIQFDGEKESEKTLAKRIMTTLRFDGFPSYFLSLPDGFGGRKNIKYTGNRDPDSLKDFCQQFV
jgi:thiol-disulfide isomerase/thioredoxin